MKTTVNFSQFCDSFSEQYRNNFTYDGKRALFDYLEQYEEDCGEDVELDPIALCCEYTEYENIAEFHDSYDKENYPDIEAIEENTAVIKVNDEAFIIQDF